MSEVFADAKTPEARSDSMRLRAPNAQVQIAKLQELASAADEQERRLEEAGFTQPHAHFTEFEGHISRKSEQTAGDVTYRTSVEGPRGLVEILIEQPGMAVWQKEYESSKLDPSFGSNRFVCGRIWYTLRQRWSPERIATARRELGLADGAAPDVVERQIHFRFQRLYRKPVDDWTAAETTEWEIIIGYISIDAYHHDNPATDNRIGRLVRVDADRVVIRWSSAGEIAHDTRSVPPELISAPTDSIVHAEFNVGNGAETWLWARVEPPLRPEEGDIYENMLSSGETLIAAHWPKVES